jgi:membrane protein
VLPDVEINWHDVWIGAAVTALLFGIGKLGLGIYLGKSSVASAYGAAGSLAILLLWIYYAAQILFFGAEFTQVYAKKYGSQIVPSPNAEFMTSDERIKQGMTGEASAQPEGASVALHPTGLPASSAKHLKSKGQRDMEFLWPAAVGFLSMLLLKARRQRPD